MNNKVKEFIRDLARFTPQYHATYKSLSEEFSQDKLRIAVEKAIKNVPYYRNNDYKNYLPSTDEPFTLSNFPILTKDDISGREKDFVSDKFFRFLLIPYGTASTFLSIYWISAFCPPSRLRQIFYTWYQRKTPAKTLIFIIH